MGTQIAGRTTLGELFAGETEIDRPRRNQVYLIWERDNSGKKQPLYIGKTVNGVRKALLAHRARSTRLGQYLERASFESWPVDIYEVSDMLPRLNPATWVRDRLIEELCPLLNSQDRQAGAQN